MRSEARGSPQSPTASVGEALKASPVVVCVGDAEAAFVEVGRIAQQVGPVDATVALTVVEGRRARNVWSSDRTAARLDAVQYRADDGPSPEAAAGSGWETALVGDLIGARASSALTAAASQDGVGSLLSVSLAFYAPMLVLPRRGQQASYGSLTVYAARPDAFTRTVIDTVLAVTRHVALAVTAKARIEVAERSRQDLAEQLREDLESRAVIERAQGILMERYQVSATKAHELLHGESMSCNLEVRDLAEEVVGSTEGGSIVARGFEREDLKSAHFWLRDLGVTLQVPTAERGQSGDTTQLGADPSEMQLPPAQHGD